MNTRGESLDEPAAFVGHKKVFNATPMQGIIIKNFLQNDQSQFEVNQNESKNTKSPFTISNKKRHKDVKDNTFQLKPLQKPSPSSTQVPISKLQQNEFHIDQIDKQIQGQKKTKINMFSIEFEDSQDQGQVIQSKQHQKKQQNQKQQNDPHIQNVSFNSLGQTQNPSLNIKQQHLKNDQRIQVEEAAQQDHQIQQAHQQVAQQVQASGLSANPSIVMENCIPFVIKRDRQWLNKLWPQFNLYYQDTNQYFMSAKMTSNNASNTFIVAQGKKDFKQNGPLYLGKIKTNVVGNIVNIFGPGYSPKDYNLKDVDIRYLLGTVEYEINVFGTTKPRNFKLYTLKPGFTYYENLVGPVKGTEEIPLNELYENPANKDMIVVYTSRKPYWNSMAKSYILNFGGRVKLPSVRNFILEEEQNSSKVKAIFGKLDNDNFRLDIANPLAPIVGFGVALSAFGNKLFCE